MGAGFRCISLSNVGLHEVGVAMGQRGTEVAKAGCALPPFALSQSGYGYEFRMLLTSSCTTTTSRLW